MSSTGVSAGMWLDFDMDLTIQSSVLNTGGVSYAVHTLAGEVDVYSAPKLRDAIAESISVGRHDVVVDLTEVAFLDSTGLGVLVGGLKRVRGVGGSLVLVGPRERVVKVFNMTGLDRVFRIIGSLDELA